MRLLIDANILLDVLQKREPYCRDAALVWKLCETGRAEGHVATLTFANLVYVMRRELGPEQLAEVWGKLSLIFRFASLTEADIDKAARMRWDDFEDAVQSAIAERIRAEYIVTRNVRDFGKSVVPAVTPAGYLEKVEGLSE